ncbi:uncharacterized protein LOC108917844 isoform X2 [Anoplophora glabripennis]|uniref:uncharacterized protein LOC108917844 isoform X2 n=1 Tax=Anoplophora glabripennis TaxID=217634 RepID=UPI000873FFDC|nr:uncharacterized protein LOC108917844 isoform X2 [Anoplophora glabripennis]
MKYPQLVSMPSAVSDWLEEQLEARGIDAVVYTRYVLSLLHTHTVDVIYPDEDLQFSRLKKNCEIESLVDELCEKLKEVNSEPGSPASQTDSTSTTTALKDTQKHKITPQELAEKYYAAFPPLCPQSPSKLISLLPKWKPATSPIKKKNVRKQNNRQTTYENKLHCNGEMIRARNQSKPRFNYLNRNKSGICRRSAERADNINNWELCALGSNNKKSVGQKLKNVSIEDTLDQCVEVNRDIWTNDDDEMKMYDDLPVDIQELLDSPCPQDDTVEMMNMANMRDDGKRNFIPYGTNITSSIWSNDTYDNKFNASVEGADSDSMLDFKFSSITIDNGNQDVPWPTMTPAAENATNSFFESSRGKRSLFLEGFRSLPDDWKASKEECFENEHLLNHLAVSLMKLNHNKEKSCFTEIIPRPKPVSQAFNPFSRTSSMFSFSSRHAVGFEREKEDLLTSERSHFKPINEKMENRAQGQYADGATFVISNSLDKVDYKRSESGSMLLETEFGQSKKYWEYKLEESTPSPDLEFILKFSICQNDKACQTEEMSELDFKAVGENGGKQKSENAEESIEEYRCTCPVFKMNAPCMDNAPEGCLVHPARPESMIGEILWKYEAKTCEKCNNNNVAWNADWLKGGQVDSEWDSQSLRNIWNGGEVCETCLNLNGGGDGRPPPSLQLREDISQDGEQLLSDLSSLQKTYMEELPLTEISCDIDEIVPSATPKERKRRHSFIAAHVDEAGLESRGSWSFASRLEEDCLIQMSTLPTLRSVTL